MVSLAKLNKEMYVNMSKVTLCKNSNLFYMHVQGAMQLLVTVSGFIESNLHCNPDLHTHVQHT
jgi:hypothetical protein